MKIGYLLLSFVCLLSCSETVEKYEIIPQPNHIDYNDGYIRVSDGINLDVNRHFDESGKALLTALALKQDVRVSNSSASTPVFLKLSGDMEKEEYELKITLYNISIRASGQEGFLHGFQSLLQLLQSESKRKINLKCGIIKDSPRFAYRGMHIDVSRHFFTIDEIKSFVDEMVIYKLNKLHLHLTDDQGWRLKIDEYPLLTEQGAWRDHNKQDESCIEKSKKDSTFYLPEKNYKVLNGQKQYGGFYEKEDIEELIVYCAERSVEVIPEVDVPGHFMVAIESYPYLACRGESGWGSTFSYPACLGKNTTYDFVENVLGEVADLFPSEYIHIGGDEVMTEEWASCKSCQKIMKENHFEKEHELQAKFNQHIEQFLSSKNKKMIGWDEIAEGDISNKSTIMWWRNWSPQTLRKAAKNGNDIIMTPDFEYYFDFTYTATPVKKVYDFKPVPEDFTKDMAKQIIGVQANLWSERIPNIDRLTYQAMPRMLALAESGWTKKDNKNFDNFNSKLYKHYSRFQRNGIYYHLPDITGYKAKTYFTDKVIFSLNVPNTEMTVRYTLDGSVPDENSKVYSKPVEITESCKVLFQASHGRVYSNVQEAAFKKSALIKPVDVITKKGVKRKYYKGRFLSCHEIKVKEEPDQEVIVDEIGLGEFKNDSDFALLFDGFYKAEKSGEYTFYSNSDDGDLFYIGEELIIDNDACHAPRERSTTIYLNAGLYPIKLLFCQVGGGAKLEMKVKTPDKEKRRIKELFY